ncbi:MAG: bacillithiol system redox-active protein YtxJ [Sphingomonadales bacterium]
MVWTPLQSEDQLEEILSAPGPFLLFKHSTRCSISNVALERLNKSTLSERLPAFLLDLLAHREISTAIATRLQIHHESPQVLVVKNGKCHYDESHLSIKADEVEEAIDKLP